MKWEGVLRKYPFGLSGDFAEFHFLGKSWFSVSVAFRQRQRIELLI
jgi:hypothetical protein